ncbi:MAG: transcriptional regulator [Rhodococcus sp. (in: high G+C Gram-positive bacteria)]
MWTTLVVPVLDWVDDGRNSEAAEASVRIFTECVTGVLSTMTLDAPIGGGRRVLLARVPSEGSDPTHPPGVCEGSDPRGGDLEFRALGAALATASVDTRMATPGYRSALLAAVANAEPDVVVLWLTSGGGDLSSLVRAIRRRRTGLTILVGGPGRQVEGLPRSVTVLGALDDTVGAVAALVRAVT